MLLTDEKQRSPATNNKVFVRLAKPSMKPLLHETGEVLMGIESGFWESVKLPTEVKK